MTSPGFPTVIVELLMGVTPSSNFFQFDDPLRGLFDNTSFTIAPDAVWYDVSQYVRSFETHRGRLRSTDQMQAGTATIVLDDNAGLFNIGATSGPYTSGGVSMLKPNMQVRIRTTAATGAQTTSLFTGYVDALVPGYSPGQYSDTTLTLTCTDFFKVLQNTTIAAGVISGAVGLTLTSWVDDLLSAPGLGYELLRTEFSPRAQFSFTMAGTSAAGSLLDEINAVCQTDMGRVYIDVDGSVVVDARYMRYGDYTHRGNQGTFTDQGTSGLLYESVVVAYDDTLVANSVTGTRQGGVAQTLTDAQSISDNWTRTYTNSSVLQPDDVSVRLNWVSYVLWLFKSAEKRVDSITIHPLGDQNLWNNALSLKIGNVITVQVNSPHGSQFSTDVFIEGVSHVVTTEPQDWHTTFSLSDASAWTGTPFLMFDDTTFGKFNTDAFGP